jgi:hypothetical protein
MMVDPWGVMGINFFLLKGYCCINDLIILDLIKL